MHFKAVRTHLKITVTEKHISKGKPWNPHQCPVALALKDAGFKYVLANKLILYVRGKGAPGVPCPPKVAMFMDKFDRGQVYKIGNDWVGGKPFTFTLKVEEDA